MDLTGIHNIGEFYSHHYLDALLDGDLKGLWARWRDEDEATPDKRLAGLATDFFAAKGRALRERRPAERYHASHAYHVELLEALGYPYAFSVRYLLDGAALPLLSTLRRDGREYLWIAETPFDGPDAAPLEQNLLNVQFPPGSEGEGLLHSPLPWEELIGEVFRRDEPPRCLLHVASSRARETVVITSYGVPSQLPSTRF